MGIIWKGSFLLPKSDYLEVVRTGKTVWRESVPFDRDNDRIALTFRAFNLPGDRLCINFDDVSQALLETEIRRRAYDQIEKNIERFATLVDEIRNPLSAILALADGCSRGPEITVRGEDIENILRQLDRGLIESEGPRFPQEEHVISQAAAWPLPPPLKVLLPHLVSGPSSPP